jgi:hypothetical protein
MLRIAALVWLSSLTFACKKPATERTETAEQKPVPVVAAPAPSPTTPASTSLPADTGAHPGTLAWVESYGGVDTDAIRGVAIAKDGSIRIAGYSKAEAQFGDAKPTPLKSSDAFVGMLAPNGKVRWVRHFGGNAEDLAEGVAVDKNGDAVVIGSFGQDLIFEKDAIKSRGADDAFIAKFDTQGQRQWLKRLGGRDVDATNAVTIDDTGTIFVTGAFREKADLGTFTLESQGEGDIFVAALAPSGDVLWARAFGGAGEDYGRAVQVNARGTIYLLAEFSRKATFDGVTLDSVANRDMALVELGRDGKAISGKAYGNEFDMLAFGLAIDPAGNVIVTGGFEAAIPFGATTLQSVGRADVFVAKFDPAQNLLWAHRMGGSDDDFGMEVETDAHGNVLVSGRFEREASFLGQTLKSQGERDVFLLKLSPEGKLLWLRGFGGPDRDSGRGLAVAESGDTLLGGAFLKTATFGDKSLTAPTPEGSLIAKTNAFLLKMSR